MKEVRAMVVLSAKSLATLDCSCQYEGRVFCRDVHTSAMRRIFSTRS